MIIGVDPGLTGAFALLDDEGGIEEVIDMPITAKTSGKGNQLNAALAADIMVQLTCFPIDAVVIERVGPMPGQGVTSMFGFGRSLGVVEGVAASCNLPVKWVTPQKWKKHFGLIGKDKDASRTLVIERFPTDSDLFKRKKDIGRADAVLIGLSQIVSYQ